MAGIVDQQGQRIAGAIGQPHDIERLVRRTIGIKAAGHAGRFAIVGIDRGLATPVADPCRGEGRQRGLDRCHGAGAGAGHFGRLRRIGHFAVIECQRHVVGMGGNHHHMIGRHAGRARHVGHHRCRFGYLGEFQ